MDFFVDLLDTVFSLLPDSIEEVVESKLPFDNGDGHLTVNDFDPTKNERISHTDMKFYEAHDGLNKQGKKFVSGLFDGSTSDTIGDVAKHIDKIGDAAKHIDNIF